MLLRYSSRDLILVPTTLVSGYVTAPEVFRFTALNPTPFRGMTNLASGACSHSWSRFQDLSLGSLPIARSLLSSLRSCAFPRWAPCGWHRPRRCANPGQHDEAGAGDPAPASFALRLLPSARRHDHMRSMASRVRALVTSGVEPATRKRSRRRRRSPSRSSSSLAAASRSSSTSKAPAASPAAKSASA